MTAPEGKALDRMEPWRNFETVNREVVALDKNGHRVADFYKCKSSNHSHVTAKEARDRTVACVNALAGCPDPDDSIETMRALVKKALEENWDDYEQIVVHLREHPNLSWLREESK